MFKNILVIFPRCYLSVAFILFAFFHDVQHTRSTQAVKWTMKNVVCNSARS